MNPYLTHMTDRELLEQIYFLLLQVNVKVNEIDNDSKQFGMNLAANLLGDTIVEKIEKHNGQKTNN